MIISHKFISVAHLCSTKRSFCILQDEEGKIVRNDDGDPLIHTDGTGFISEDLAMKCPKNIYKGNCLIHGDPEVYELLLISLLLSTLKYKILTLCCFKETISSSLVSLPHK